MTFHDMPAQVSGGQDRTRQLHDVADRPGTNFRHVQLVQTGRSQELLTLVGTPPPGNGEATSGYTSGASPPSSPGTCCRGSRKTTGRRPPCSFRTDRRAIEPRIPAGRDSPSVPRPSTWTRKPEAVRPTRSIDPCALALMASPPSGWTTETRPFTASGGASSSDVPARS